MTAKRRFGFSDCSLPEMSSSVTQTLLSSEFLEEKTKLKTIILENTRRHDEVFRPHDDLVSGICRAVVTYVSYPKQYIKIEVKPGYASLDHFSRPSCKGLYC
jgi:hypothetical protein